MACCTWPDGPCPSHVHARTTPQVRGWHTRCMHCRAVWNRGWPAPTRAHHLLPCPASPPTHTDTSLPATHTHRRQLRARACRHAYSQAHSTRTHACTPRTRGVAVRPPPTLTPHPVLAVKVHSLSVRLGPPDPSRFNAYTTCPDSAAVLPSKAQPRSSEEAGVLALPCSSSALAVAWGLLPALLPEKAVSRSSGSELLGERADTCGWGGRSGGGGGERAHCRRGLCL